MNERRIHPRVESANHVSYICLNQSDEEFRGGFGRTMDVSENGMLLETEEPLEACCVLLMGISLQDEWNKSSASERLVLSLEQRF